MRAAMLVICGMNPLLYLVGLLLVSGSLAQLPNTQPLTMGGDLSAQMHEAALREMDSWCLR